MADKVTGTSPREEKATATQDEVAVSISYAEHLKLAADRMRQKVRAHIADMNLKPLLDVALLLLIPALPIIAMIIMIIVIGIISYVLLAISGQL